MSLRSVRARLRIRSSRGVLNAILSRYPRPIVHPSIQLVTARISFSLAIVIFLFSTAISPAASVTSVTFSNANTIVINDGMTPPTVATPYPSSISVTGFPGQVVSKATVTIDGFTHGFPSDVNILLVGPQGQKTILLANVGGQNKYSVTNLVLTLDDDAPSALPIFTRLVSGTFKPTDGYAALGYPNLPFEFPPPAPAGNSNAPTALSVFKNTDPNGTWKLFVVDDVSPDGGMIAGGWSLTISAGFALDIRRVQTNTVVSWSASATNCSLQTSAGLAMPWSNVTNTPVLNAGRNYVTNSINGNSKFYRLIQHTP